MELTSAHLDALDCNAFEDLALLDGKPPGTPIHEMLGGQKLTAELTTPQFHMTGLDGPVI